MSGLKFNNFRVEVGTDEKDDKILEIIGSDRQGNDVISVGFPLETAKDIGYALLRLCYRLENNLPIPKRGRKERHEADGTEE